MIPDFWERLVAIVLVLYLLAVGLGAAFFLVSSFEQLPLAPLAGQQAPAAARLLQQTFLAGVVGSFLHAAQSLTSYIGNGTFKMSWTSWYVMRPWIGGILGLAMAFAARAGLVGAGNGEGNVYGMVALGLLGGWFSKTTTDKLQEVFSTLFKTDADKERTDKLKGDQPTVTKINLTPVPATATDIVVTGTGFLSGVIVTINKITVDATFVSANELKVSLAKLVPRPVGDVKMVVKNPSGPKPESDSFTVKFE